VTVGRRRPAERLQFTGRITGFGTTSGDRFVVGWWDASPFGPFVDVMHQRADGLRRLVAPDGRIADFVSATYDFDAVTLAPCEASRHEDRIRLEAGGLRAEVDLGRRSGLGRLLRVVPPRVATAPAWCTITDPIARRVLRGVRTRGSAAGGRREYYGATDHHHLLAVRATLDGEDLGPIADLWPAVTFGFGSAPRRPSIVELVTTVEV
jgi:hypothetical protein